jgi:osmotically-inducible protein OsmY
VISSIGSRAPSQKLNIFDQEQVSDVVLEQRIRTALGRAVSHPGAIEVNCTEGSVFLGGWILADEIDELNSVVRSVRGVRELSTFLNTTDHPEHISALQAGRAILS